MQGDGAMKAVITGGATGIGAAVACRIAGQGGEVVIGDIDLDTAEATAAEIREAGGTAWALVADHADPESLEAFAERAFGKLHTVDLVFANAGVGAGGPLYSTPQRNIDWVFAVNLIGPISLARAFVPRLIEAGRPARFIITASEHAIGLPPRGGQASVYTVSKHGALGVAETLRRDLAETPVAVSVICPAIVNSEIWNPLRTRHDRFGGPRMIDPARKPAPDYGMAADMAAERIMAGIEDGEFYLFTHGRDIAEVHEARANEIAAALARFAERYGAEA
jgi:NAD(P)-dependent dehydrogenase (short-subunit alcohol dehydrogenase family)